MAWHSCHGRWEPSAPAEPTANRREREQHPRFLDAWPIVTGGGGDPATLPGVDVIYRQGDDVVALFRRMGKGGLLLISDTRFFSDMNVEDMSGYWVGNLALIHDLFKKYLGADPDTVKPFSARRRSRCEEGVHQARGARRRM